MPHSTHAYPFEAKVGAWASAVSQALTGVDRAFLLVLDQHGAAKSLLVEEPRESWSASKRKLEEAQLSFIFYDPFDAPDYTWLEWFNVQRAILERIIQRPFDDSDFVRQPYRSLAGNAIQTYPATWGVMF